MLSPVTHLRAIAPAAPAPSVLPKDSPVFSTRPRARPRGGQRPLGQILLDMRAVDPGNMLKALALRDREEARLGDILLTRGWVSEADLMTALAAQWKVEALNLKARAPDARLLDRVGAETCLAHAILPWRRAGGALVIATARPETFAAALRDLPHDIGPVVMALAPERDIHAAILAARQSSLIEKAEARSPEPESCRSLAGTAAAPLLALALFGLVAAAVTLPVLALYIATALSLVALVAWTTLKLATFRTMLSEARRPAPPPGPPPALGRLPLVSVMVPLFREDDIAPRLVRRLGRLDYPKELLDILLVVEEDDKATQAALAGRNLPRWMRIVTVPRGKVRTKPRALNYALDFCRGSIIGIWDAEDEPDPGQIHAVVRRFHEAPPEVACLQGILDFYNAGHNWITRCFAIEYAAWFRVLLPGLARLGLVVPLGGTTLFFRRAAIEELGGWDAHNVTEDADLGIRLARRGYRTETLPTVTREEPNGRALSWVRQRSRWQKGFAMTWASHMRAPHRLWRDLGPYRFLGVQVMLLGSLVQALLAPVQWSFWLLAAGLPHPLANALPRPVLYAFVAFFIAAAALNLAVGLWATRGGDHRHLMKWVPMLALYNPMATLSSYKALYECLSRPFYWDKTAHGIAATHSDKPDLLPVLILTDPVHVPGPALAPREMALGPVRPAARLHLTIPEGLVLEPDPPEVLPEAPVPRPRPNLQVVG